MNETEQLAQLCQRLGAPRAQAETMAAQLLKARDGSWRPSAGSRVKRRSRVCWSWS